MLAAPFSLANQAPRFHLPPGLPLNLTAERLGGAERGVSLPTCREDQGPNGGRGTRQLTAPPGPGCLREMGRGSLGQQLRTCLGET